MRNLRFIRPVVAGVAVVGLACGLTATTALASTARKASHPAVLPTTVTWHKLTLLNGWKSARSTSFHTANPSYAVYGGIVYLDGAMYQPAGTNHEFAVLPPGARPAHKLFLTVASGGEFAFTGTVKITPSGVMTASSPTNTTRFATCLAAVSFPAAGGTWHTMALLNSWHSGATAFGTGNPAFTVRSGIVYLAGSLFTHGGNTLAAQLGIHARPRSNVYISVYDHGGLAGSVEITPGGSVYVYGATSRTQTALDGISYPTKAANLSWHLFTLINGWSSSQGAYQTGDPEYAVRGPIVYLAGSMNSPTSGLFTHVPSAAQATNIVARQVYTYNTSTGILIFSPQDGEAASATAADAEKFTSLAGVAYPKNS